MAAAIRKLQHELGMKPEQIPPAAFRFLTRLHYCAADDSAKDSPWGEHELDYILVARVALPEILPHPEEVSDTRLVTRDELAAMMDPASGLRWSPWFRIIADRFLPVWWEKLDAVMDSGACADYSTIHRFDT